MELFHYLFRLFNLINQACCHVTWHHKTKLFLWQIVSQNEVNNMEIKYKTGITCGAKFIKSVSAGVSNTLLNSPSVSYSDAISTPKRRIKNVYESLNSLLTLKPS